MFNFRIVISSLIIPLCLTACSSTPKTQTTAATQKDRAMNQQDADRDAYVKATQARIDKIAKLGSDLKSGSAKTDKVRAKKMQNASEDLNSLLDDVRQELADVKSALPQNWVDEKRDVEQSLNRAETQYSNSVQLLR